MSCIVATPLPMLGDRGPVEVMIEGGDIVGLLTVDEVDESRNIAHG
jgi:hypothetical protein